tara:strand:- start:4892 stop:5272 length:381 start_codon:yes stop_codon:yes gene_type:complete
MEWLLLTQCHASLARPEWDAASVFACVAGQSSSTAIFVPPMRDMSRCSPAKGILAPLSNTKRDVETIPPRKFGASGAVIATLAAVGPEVSRLSEDFFTQTKKKSTHAQYTDNAASRQHRERCASTL